MEATIIGLHKEYIGIMEETMVKNIETNTMGVYRV